jgi:beta-galactosidase
MTRTSFNDGWAVRPKKSLFAELSAPASPPQPVTLPHDALIALQRSADSVQGSHTGYFPDGAFEYSKTFEVPEEYRGQRVSLEFQGVYRDAMVYVNGDFAGQRPFGYSTFTIKLDPFLKYGQPNTIKVDARVHEDSRWYTGAGIYRDTVLSVTGLVHLAPHGVRITTPDIDDRRAVVDVATTVENEGVETATVTVATELRDAAGSVVARGSAPVTLRAGSNAVVRQRLYVTDPLLWGVDSPYLYTAKTELTDLTEVLEESHSTFGIRSLQLDPYRGLQINGETVKLRGACIHHDNGILGAATIGRAEERRIQLLKEAGFNSIRSSHNPISQAMLDACDKHGMLVMDETFDVWTDAKSSFDYSLSFPEWWERDVEAMVTKDFNHPSVILYSIGNEIPETGSGLGSDWGRKLAEKIRSMDGTRYITNGINGFVSAITEVSEMMRQRASSADSDGEGKGVNAMMSQAGEFMNRISASPLVTEKTAESHAVVDVAGINYGDGRYVQDKELFPNRIIVGTETFPTHIDVSWKLVEENPHVIGDYTWTGWDYLGEAGIGRVHYADETGGKPSFGAPYPWLLAWCGDIDITGYRRPASYYRETVFGLRHEPYIAVQRPENHDRECSTGQWSWSDSISSWSWNVPAGSPVRVEVYSDADEVELQLNGQTIGRRPAGREHRFRADFDLTYYPGELVAIGYTGGLEQARTVLRSATGDIRLMAEADRAEITADHTDLSHITIEFRDAEGNLATNVERTVAVTVEGAGVLQGLGSARPATEETYHAPSHTSFDGRLLAVVRPTGTGEITVTATAEGYAPATVILESLPAGSPVLLPATTEGVSA